MTREEIYSVSASATLNALIYMTQIYIAVVVISITRGEIKHLSLRNWHLAEGYIFLTFILLAPQSVLEVLGTSGSFDPTAFSEKIIQRLTVTPQKIIQIRTDIGWKQIAIKF
jgi:hypothetical protein